MPSPRSLLKPFEKAATTDIPNPKKRMVIFDPGTTGLALIVSPKGKKTFTIVARDPTGKQIWKEVGDPFSMTVDQARQKARMGVARIKAGEATVFPVEKPPVPEKTFQQVHDEYIKTRVMKEGVKDPRGNPAAPLRSAGEIKRIFKVYVLPVWKDEKIASIDQDDVVDLLDKVRSNRGARQSDAVFAQLSALFRWWVGKKKGFISPTLYVERATKTSERARSRVLGQDENGKWTRLDEIKDVWNAASALGTFGAFIQLALLTGQRREKLSKMRRQDIKDGVWTIPFVSGEKGAPGELKLPQMALEIIERQPEVKDNPYVFAGRGKKAIAGFSAGKKLLDQKAPIPHWVIHDLRRTAKSLMRRARVDSEISEHVLGHRITGVEGVYDRHDYYEEKGEALQALANQIARILDPKDNVVEIKGAVA